MTCPGPGRFANRPYPTRMLACAFAAMLCGAPVGACTDAAPIPERSPQAASAPAPSVQTVPPSRLTIRESRFYAGDTPFDWRGISAFALVEQIAHGRESDAAAYLDWAARNQLTVVRVLTMARHLFTLSPEEGRTALPRLLEMASTRGLYVEVVALADTAAIPVELDGHVKAIGTIAAEHANALIEIANEPGHRTQHPDVHDAGRLKALAAFVPDEVLVALGSAEYGSDFAGGDYATFHFRRDPRADGWGHVLRLAEGAKLVSRWRKPVVSDEPIGAGPRFVAGRRDNEPARFGAAALLTRLAGMYPTFHYEGGLLAKIPSGPELEALQAWLHGLRTAEGVPLKGTEFVQGEHVSAIARSTGARAAFARVGKQEAWLLLVDPRPQASAEWTAGWRQDGRWEAPGARLLRGRRD